MNAIDKFVKLEDANLPFDELSLNDDELFVIKGGSSGSGRGNGCSCDSRGDGCDCPNGVITASEGNGCSCSASGRGCTCGSGTTCS